MERVENLIGKNMNFLKNTLTQIIFYSFNKTKIIRLEKISSK
jgi:hypothetical protein